MLNTDQDALLCDLAETYNIFEIKELPVTKVALFCVGLRDNSRIKMKLANVNYELKDILLMSVVDYLAVMVWQKTKDARTGKNRPQSILNKLLDVENKEDDVVSFASSEEFEKARAEILKKGGINEH